MGLLAALCLMAGFFLLIRFALNAYRHRAITEADERMHSLIRAEFDSDSVVAPLQIGKSDKKANESLFVGFSKRGGGRLSRSSVFADEEGRAAIKRLERTLHHAGIRDKVSPYDAIAFALMVWGTAITFALFGLLEHVLNPFMCVGIMLMGVLYPLLKLQSMVNRRQEEIRADIPFFIQDLVMALSSGSVTIDDAIYMVGEKARSRNTGSILAKEFMLAHSQYRNGALKQEDALRGISERTGVLPVEDLVNALIDGIRNGSPLVRMLQEYADHAREMWKQDMRAFIKKQDTKFTVYLGITMFGGFILFVAPMLISLLMSFKQT
jgi:Flp pilus assembly protein TadB